MRVPCHFLRIPRVYAVTRRPHHGPVQSPNYPRLAGTPESQRHPVFPRIRQLLSSFHFWILRNHCSAYMSYPQGYPLALHRARNQTWCTHSLDDGTSILKRGIVAMPVLIHRNFAQYSLPSNWHHPSKLPPYQSQSSMNPSLWMLKSFTLTSDLIFERIPFPQNTLI